MLQKIYELSVILAYEGLIKDSQTQFCSNRISTTPFKKSKMFILKKLLEIEIFSVRIFDKKFKGSKNSENFEMSRISTRKYFFLLFFL